MKRKVIRQKQEKPSDISPVEIKNKITHSFVQQIAHSFGGIDLPWKHLLSGDGNPPTLAWHTAQHSFAKSDFVIEAIQERRR